MKFNYGKIFLLGIGFFMTLDNIAALLIQPPVGAWSDRLRTRIGRRMPFILIGAPVGAIAFGFIPMAAILPLFVACTSTLLLSMAFWRTPVIALMPDVTPSRYRSQANSVINLMGGIGSIIAFLGGSMLYKIDPAFPFWSGSVLVVLSAALVFIFIREPKDHEQTGGEPSMFSSLSETVKDQDKSALRLFLAIFFWFLGYTAIEAFFTLYAEHHLGLDPSDGSRLLSHLSLFFVLFALVAGFVGAKIGRRVTISIGISLLTVLIATIFFLPPAVLTTVLTRLPVLDTIPVISVFLMACGAAWAFININSLPMVVDLTTTAKLGTYTGLYYRMPL